MNAKDLVPCRFYKVGTRIAVFSRIGGTGLAVFHPPGEPDMQSSWAVPPAEVEREAYLSEVERLVGREFL